MSPATSGKPASGFQVHRFRLVIITVTVTVSLTATEEQFVYWDAAGGLSLIAPLTNHSLSLVPPSITVITTQIVIMKS